MRRHSLILMAGLLLGLGLYASAEPYRVAVLPAWKNWGHVHDYDFALREAGCSFTNLVESAEQMDWLDKNLDAFDLLIAPPLFHFEKGKAADPDYARPYDMAKHARRIAEWIQKGGCLLVTDANYASGLSWFQHLDPAMALTACVDPKDLKTEFKCNGMGPAVAKEPLDSILFFPSQAEYGFGWGHMVIPDESKTAWDVLARCGHGQPTMLVRRWGQGIVLVNSLRSHVPEFLENIRVNQQFLKLGITVRDSLMPDPLPGTNSFSFTCANGSVKPLVGELALSLTPLKPGEDGNAWVPAGQARVFRQSGTIPAGTNGTIRLDCRIPMRGRVRATMTFSSGGLSANCFDRDVVLPELFRVSSTRFRGIVSKDRRYDTVSVGVHFFPDAEDPAKHTMHFSVVDAKGKEVAKTEAPAAMRASWVPISLPRSLPVGLYTLLGDLRREGAADPVAKAEAPLEIAGSGPGFTLVDEDNVLLSNGKPFFPLGIYHPGVPKDLGGYSGEFARLADMGFNTINLFSWAGLGNVQTLNTLGVRAFWEQLPHRAPAACRAQGDELASNPATLLNYTMDEPSEAQFDFVKSLDQAWREADRYHPTVVVSYQPHHFARNAYLSDILAPDPYPWSSAKGDDSNVRMVSEWMVRAREASGGTRPYLCVPQAFGGEPPHVWRNMALQAIIHGAKGLIWYAWN